MILDSVATIHIDLSKHFPFDSPGINIDLKEEELYYSLFDLKYASFEDIMREHWHPSIKVVDIAEKAVEFVHKNTIEIEKVPHKLTRLVHGLLTLEKPLSKLFLVVFLFKLLMIVSLCFNDAISKELYSGIKVQYS